MKTFYFFGDSITLGVNVIKDDAWTSLLTSNMKAHGVPIPPTTFYNLGARRHCAKDISKRFLSEFNARNLPCDEAFFIFMFGTVDTLSDNGKVFIEQEESIKYTEQVLIDAKKLGKCLFLTSPPLLDKAHNLRLGNLITEQKKVCESLEIDLVDIYTELSQDHVYIQDCLDGIHPQEMGNRTIFDIVWASTPIQTWLIECTEIPEVIPEIQDFSTVTTENVPISPINDGDSPVIDQISGFN